MMRSNAAVLALALALALLAVTAVTRPVSALYTSGDAVVELTQSNFRSSVLSNTDDVWLVEFYAPWCGHCKNLAPDYKKVASALQGVAKVGAVDMTQHESVGAPYGIQGFPTIKLFIGDKKKPIDYNGQRTASAMATFVLDQIKSQVNAKLSGKTGSSKSSSSSSKSSGGGSGSKGSSGSKKSGKSVITLDDASFQSEVLDTDDLWLVEFFAPWCGHCQRLEPEWERAATELKDAPVKFAAVDATVHQQLASKYGVKGYPTIKVFKPGKKNAPEDYQGGRTASDIVTYAQRLADKIVPPKPKVVRQITSSSDLDETCAETTCIVAFLPHILDSGASGRNTYLDALKAVSATHARKPVQLAWVEAGAQPDLEQFLSLGEGYAFYPSLTAWSAKKGRVATFRGSFTVASIDKFVTGLMAGSERLAPLKGEAKVVVTEAWDGKDAPKPMADEL